MCQRPGCAGRARDRNAARDADGVQPRDDILSEAVAAVGFGDRAAGDVEPETVRRIGRDQRGVAFAPRRQPAQRRGVRTRIGFDRREIGADGARVGQGLAAIQAAIARPDLSRSGSAGRAASLLRPAAYQARRCAAAG
jgi:hypothetical protein